MYWSSNNYKKLKKEGNRNLIYNNISRGTIDNNKKANCWKRYFTDRNTNEMLNVIVDINTHEKEENEVTLEFIEKFIAETDKYISENISFTGEK